MVGRLRVGVLAAKRRLAHTFRLDVYTRNEDVQRALNSLAWAEIAGGFGMAASFNVSPGPGYSGLKAGFLEKMNRLLAEHSPDDLRALNHTALEELGLEKEPIEALLSSSFYTTRDMTLMVQSLAGMSGTAGRREFALAAAEADSIESAFVYRRLAEVMGGYHTKIRPVNEISMKTGQAVMLTPENRAVLPLVVDYGAWTPLLEDVVQAARVDHPDRQIELVISGKLSPRAREELVSRGIVPHEEAFSALAPVL